MLKDQCGSVTNRGCQRLRLLQELDDVLTEPEPRDEGRVACLEPDGSGHVTDVEFDGVGFQVLFCG